MSDININEDDTPPRSTDVDVSPATNERRTPGETTKRPVDVPREDGTAEDEGTDPKSRGDMVKTMSDQAKDAGGAQDDQDQDLNGED